MFGRSTAASQYFLQLAGEFFIHVQKLVIKYEFFIHVQKLVIKYGFLIPIQKIVLKGLSMKI